MTKVGVMTVVFNAYLHPKPLELSCASDDIEGLTKMFVCVCFACREQQQSVQHRQTEWVSDKRPQGSRQRNQQFARVGSGSLQQWRGQHEELRQGKYEDGHRGPSSLWCQKALILAAFPYLLQVIIYVNDANDEVPVFTQQQYNRLGLRETAGIGTSVIVVRAKDPDTGERCCEMAVAVSSSSES